MAKTKISEYSTTNSSNTDINSINIDEGCAPSGINNAIREVMVHLRNWQTNASGDGATFASLVVQGTGSFTGAVTMSAGATLSGTNTLSGATVLAAQLGTSASPSIYFTSDTNTGIFSPTADTVAVATGGSERVRIDSSGNVTLQKNISVGGATPTTSGTGITFPATQSASSDANTLDDYEEGTWTPVIDSATPGTGRVTNVSSAKYTKIGNVVTIHCYIGLSTLGTGGSGAWVVTGLPFTVASGNYGALSVPYSSNLNGNLVFISARADPSTTTIYVTGQAAAGTIFNTIPFSTYVKANTDIIIGGSYFTS